LCYYDCNKKTIWEHIVCLNMNKEYGLNPGNYGDVVVNQDNG
jgi:hypothetical protein